MNRIVVNDNRRMLHLQHLFNKSARHSFLIWIVQVKYVYFFREIIKDIFAMYFDVFVAAQSFSGLMAHCFIYLVTNHAVLFLLIQQVAKHPSLAAAYVGNYKIGLKRQIFRENNIKLFVVGAYCFDD